ncbi:hypothetical protein ADL25_43955 [Streptomyces sp. NRRL F-5122]|nr:hypothetical protein ADL25_43955 [Streptomyces sp. NRRL F-5122]
MQNEVTGAHLADECVGPVFLPPIIDLGCKEVGADVFAVGDLQPVAFGWILSPPSIYGHGPLPPNRTLIVKRIGMSGSGRFTLCIRLLLATVEFEFATDILEIVEIAHLDRTYDSVFIE